jgi:hypothetical protein
MCDYRRGLNWWIALLTTYTHNLELQVITAPALISTLYNSPQHKSFLSCCVFTSRFLVTASNSGESSTNCRLNVIWKELTGSHQLKRPSWFGLLPALGPTQPPIQCVPFPGSKATGAWSWRLTSILCRCQEWWNYTSTPLYIYMAQCFNN